MIRRLLPALLLVLAAACGGTALGGSAVSSVDDRPNAPATTSTTQVGADESRAEDADGEDGVALQRALDALSKDDREIIVLRDLEGMTGPEVAEVLGLELTAVNEAAVGALFEHVRWEIELEIILRSDDPLRPDTQWREMVSAAYEECIRADGVDVTTEECFALAVQSIGRLSTVRVAAGHDVDVRGQVGRGVAQVAAVDAGKRAFAGDVPQHQLHAIAGWQRDHFGVYFHTHGRQVLLAECAVYEARDQAGLADGEIADQADLARLHGRTGGAAAAGRATPITRNSVRRSSASDVAPCGGRAIASTCSGGRL